ncbi:triose-phosphate isomerase [Helicobacter sp. 11S02596-1]|uniref:triose-phosphate isomerase n=1 Tax=Helicobacter sp. 11S02596-1 TaxID=1476194 RepID=UPI000BA6B91C|nr:triose-phosphate isomerase [Helicobacter sp. 11S02596-1]PAF43569.1 triose-phosphate isomerase [Helicobacter sp. 11S02596-1]
MQKIIAANFKANHTQTSTKKYLQELDNRLLNMPLSKNSHRVYVFPQVANLCANDFTSLKIGTQNAYPAYNGAFTGEITLEALEEFGITTILIGHSERRNILNETQAFCAEKFAFFAQKGFEIIYCVGEDLSVRQKGGQKEDLEALKDFIQTQFEGIDTGYEKLIIAYEPIWAIGTGITATIEQIRQTHQAIKSIAPAPLLYGGSVNAENSSQILSLKEVDGVLVGRASLDVESFYQIIQNSYKENK